ncbi:hypothetical protein V500_09834 [Pseudogymnoascus sp. VKM F-4518 (FW-2643)]|nr:hypothetical protein V500_09834 [Pseudogymnoascus sp. VKM F-4518 (FW-2643)]
MASIFRLMQRFLKQPPSTPRQFPATGFDVLERDQLIEEETLPHYSPTQFFSVRIGEILNAKYQVVGKLGYGGNSTAWLCRDLSEHKYVAVKVCRRESEQVTREIQAYKHLNTLTSSHSGALLIREMIDSFDISNAQGKYPCIVHKPLSMSLARLRSKCPNRRLPVNVLKPALVHILLALDFLHSEAHIIHTDLQEGNIILGIEDDSILEEYETNELRIPSPRKVDGDRIIYKSRGLEISKDPGRPVITDFGEARIGQQTYDDDIQPFQYRAPEVIMDAPWSYKVDIWNVGVMIWDLFEDKNMFNAKGPDGIPDSLYHMAYMTALLGPPPVDFLEHCRIERRQEYYDSKGEWKGLAEIPRTSLEESEENLDGKDKRQFLEFMRKMLKWRPEERSSAKELLQDTWLRSKTI